MTITLSRPSKSGGAATTGLPQVNLLPPEVRSARALKPVKRWMGIVLVIAVLAVAGGYALGTLARNSAETELESAHAETARLQAEALQYAEVPVVLGAIDDAELARQLGMSSEVLWADYLGAIEAVIGTEVSIDTLAVARTLGDIQGPLEAPAVATMTVTGRSLELPDTVAWIDALDSIPGFANTRVTVATLTLDTTGSEDATDDEGADGDDGDEEAPPTYYTFTTSVQVTLDALSGRFFLEGGE